MILPKYARIVVVTFASAFFGMHPFKKYYDVKNEWEER